MLKFLKWGRQKDELPKVPQPQEDDDRLPSAVEEAPALSPQYTNLDLRRSVLDWRDKHMERIEIQLRKNLPRLHAQIHQACRHMGWNDIRSQHAYSGRVIQPLFTQWAEMEAKELAEAAQKDLAPLYAHPIGFTAHSTALQNEESTTHISDAKKAAMAITTATAVIPIFSSMSVVAAGGIAGVLGMTVIAWPVVAVGAVVVGSLFAFGGTKAAKMKDKAINSYKEKLLSAIESQVFGANAHDESINALLQSSIEAYAATRLKEIDQC